MFDENATSSTSMIGVAPGLGGRLMLGFVSLNFADLKRSYIISSTVFTVCLYHHLFVLLISLEVYDVNDISETDNE